MITVLSWIVLSTLVDAEITYIEVKYPLPGTRSPPGSPWPYPTQMIICPLVLTFNPTDFIISSNIDQECDILPEAFERYKKLIFIDPEGIEDPIVPALSGLKLTVSQSSTCQGYPGPNEDESYSLQVNGSSDMLAYLQANSVWGALRGLETFSQLVYQNNHAYLINITSIQDIPRYSYRGLLLDTARHFLPLTILKQTLDAMSYNKFNVFHWHIVDDQSWPFESKVYPNLTNAAYTPRHIYTQEHIEELIDYARLRGIRVIPEFDTPGHTQAIGKIFPELLTTCYGKNGEPFTPISEVHGAAEILNPSLNYTYDFFKILFQEIKDLFKDEYIHLGMDEVYYACWESNPDIKKFMKSIGLKEYSELENYYINRTLKNIEDIGYKYILWQDPIENKLVANSQSIIQVWKGNSSNNNTDKWQDYIKSIASKGYRIILSSCWYVNRISYGEDWKEYYKCDPREFEGTEEEKNLVIGGEACMWGEFVDGTNIMSRLWPRTSAVAERLWSSADLKDADSAAFRLDEHRCRMIRRGIPAEPILNGFCGEYEWEMEFR